jgi:CRP/FNR family cyclic AMP-dependent transcriptional regulator
MIYVEWIGYIAAALGIATFAMQTMIPLRVTGIIHNLGQIAFGLISGIYPMVIQHFILLPLNCYRLFEMRKLIKTVEASSEGSHSLDWLTPFMKERRIKAGQVLVAKGEDAKQMYFVADGCVHLPEINIDLGPGAVVGELGMLAPDRKRTQTVVCTKDATILEIAYTRIEQLYYQNPTFGFYFLKLSTQGLFDNIERLERTLTERDAEIR